MCCQDGAYSMESNNQLLQSTTARQTTDHNTEPAGMAPFPPPPGQATHNKRREDFGQKELWQTATKKG